MPENIACGFHPASSGFYRLILSVLTYPLESGSSKLTLLPVLKNVPNKRNCPLILSVPQENPECGQKNLAFAPLLVTFAERPDDICTQMPFQAYSKIVTT